MGDFFTKYLKNKHKSRKAGNDPCTGLHLYANLLLTKFHAKEMTNENT